MTLHLRLADSERTELRLVTFDDGHVIRLAQADGPAASIFLDSAQLEELRQAICVALADAEGQLPPARTPGRGRSVSSFAIPLLGRVSQFLRS